MSVTNCEITDLMEADLLDIPISTPPDAKYYHIRDALAYCKERGISIEDISDEELKQFEYTPS